MTLFFLCVNSYNTLVYRTIVLLVMCCCCITAPHQPRLDWQMWFAALASYQNNPWFLNLVYRLLTNERDGL